MEVIPGRVDDHGDHLLVETRTIVRWKGSSEVADINPQKLAFHVREGLIARVEIRTPPITPSPG